VELAGVDRLAVRGFLAAEQRRGLAKRPVARALSALRTFYRFLNATRGVEVNPARAARTPKLEKTLPTYLDRAEVEKLFADAEARAAAGGLREARDLAMLELFYSTGMRLSELAGSTIRCRSRLRPGQAAGQGQEGTHRAGGLARHGGVAENTCSNGTGSWPRRTSRIASRVREPARQANYATRRATRDEAAV